MITVETKQFTRALGLVGSVIQRRNTIPVLGTAKIAANGVLKIEGSDLDTTITAALDYDGKPFEALALMEPARVRLSIAAAGGAAVSLEPRDGALGLETGTFAIEATTLPGDDHPGEHRIGKPEFTATLGPETLRQIARVMRAVSTDECRYYLNGVCLWRLGDWTWRACATDGHRLMFVDLPLPDADGELPDKIIVPRRYLELALRHFAKAERVRLNVGRAELANEPEGGTAPERLGMPRVMLSGESGGVALTMASKVIDGTYPDAMRVVPAAPAHRIEVSRGDLLRAIQAVTALAGEKIRALSLTTGKGTLTVSIKSVDLGTGRFSIPAKHNLPDDFTIGFNGQYLRDCVEALSGETVAIGFDDAAAPARIEDPADTAFLSVLMPMRL